MWHISCTTHYGEGSSLAAPDITLFLTLTCMHCLSSTTFHQQRYSSTTNSSPCRPIITSWGDRERTSCSFPPSHALKSLTQQEELTKNTPVWHQRCCSHGYLPSYLCGTPPQQQFFPKSKLTWTWATWCKYPGQRQRCRWWQILFWQETKRFNHPS